jgi:RNA polymerase sigma-70 factor (ECF subfamily)
MSATKESQLEAQATQEPEPSTVLEKKEELSRVLQILETLPPNQQEVIRLKFQNGLSYREISDVTHLSVSNVGFLLHTGLKTVRQKLEAWSRSSSTPIRRIK